MKWYLLYVCARIHLDFSYCSCSVVKKRWNWNRNICGIFCLLLFSGHLYVAEVEVVKEIVEQGGEVVLAVVAGVVYISSYHALICNVNNTFIFCIVCITTSFECITSLSLFLGSGSSSDSDSHTRSSSSDSSSSSGSSSSGSSSRSSSSSSSTSSKSRSRGRNRSPSRGHSRSKSPPTKRRVSRLVHLNHLLLRYYTIGYTYIYDRFPKNSN